MQRKEKRIMYWLAVLIFGIAVLAGTNVFGAVAGDIDNSKAVDLKDAVISLQISADIPPSSYVYKKYEMSGDDRIGLEESVNALQVAAGLRAQAVIWYKDADGDRYSDGTRWISAEKPSSVYYDESELIATSGDENDDDPNIHPDTAGKWIPFDDAGLSEQDDPLDVNVPVSTSQEVIIEYSIPGMKAAETPEEGQIYDILNINGCGYTNEVGKPQVPVVRRYVAIPEGASASFSVIASDYRDIDNYYVYPVQEALPEIEDAQIPPFEIDSATYQTNAFYPSEPVHLEGPVIIRGTSMLIAEIHPVLFNPATKTLRVYSYMKIGLTFQGGGRSFRSTRLASPSFDNMLKRLVLNNDFLSSETGARAAYDADNSLLIITHPNFINAANTLKNWKTKKGILTEVRTTAQTGSTASAIQTYIRTAYNTWNPPPTYVLFIGDAEFIPTHYVTVHPYHKTRTGTDLYYTTVDGSDYFPDINIGRLSVDTAAEADKRINDIIGYEKAVVTDSGFYTKAAICAEFQDEDKSDPKDGWAARRFAQTSEDMAIFLSDASYLGKYAVDRIYNTNSDVIPEYWSKQSWVFGGGPAGNPRDPIPSYLKKPGFAWNGNSSVISSAINSGRFLVTHRDHGSPYGWGKPGYSVSNVQSLTNGNKLPVVWSINCQTGWFDNETDEETSTSLNSIHFSEAWERNPNGGAIGVIGASRVSYSGDNDRLIWGWMDAIWPGFESYSASNTPFDEPLWEMGQVLNYGKYYYATKYGDNLYRKTEFEMFHWFGDPTMQIWTDVPQTLTVSHPSSLSSGATSVDVTVNQADAVICVSKNGVILSRKLSVNGANTLSWSAALVQGDVVYVTVTKHNFRPYEGSASCSAAACTYSISPTSKSFTSSGGTGSVSVTAGTGCTWTAVSNATSWLTVTSGASVTGNGTVAYSVLANTTASSRTGTITIAGKTFTVTQPAPCSYSISPTSQSFTPSAGTCGISVNAADGCSWSASESLSWVTIISGSSGSGNGTVSYSFSPNTDTLSRSGTMTIAGKTFTITQAGVADDPMVFDYYLTDYNDKATLSVRNTSETYSVVAKVMFTSSDLELLGFLIYLLPGDSWEGDIVNISGKMYVKSTDDSAYIAAGIWASETSPINQPFFTSTCISPCNPLIGKINIYGAFATTGITHRNALAQACPFTVFDSVDLYDDIPKALSFASTVIQSGVSYSYSISPSRQAFTSSAGSGSITVTASNGYAWTASENLSWITITSGSSGSGNGTVSYSVSANTGADRNGTMTIAGKTFTVTQSGIPTVVVFPDANLEAVVRTAINKPSGDILQTDLENLTDLNADSKSIKNIEGIQYCTNLTSLNLSSNQISDISAVAGLTNLMGLYLSSNQISYISAVAGLTNLKFLYLDSNQISNISAVAGLTTLTELHLDSNQISDISAVAGLTNLTGLSLSSNQISDISAVAGLTNLKYLSLDSNQISSISAVAGLTNLTVLYLDSNQISDISAVAGLTKLMGLYLDSNQISSISAVAGLTNLMGLNLSSNQISDISAVAGLTKLMGLYLSSNQISDISAVAGLTNLKFLYLDSNQISDISAVAGLTNLTYLYLSSNQISNISAVTGLTNLTVLVLFSNQISDIKPLVDNSGIGSGDNISLRSNPLSTESCKVYVPQLLNRGVTLYHNCTP